MRNLSLKFKAFIVLMYFGYVSQVFHLICYDAVDNYLNVLPRQATETFHVEENVLMHCLAARFRAR